ncbi:MAG: serine/threonine protein kinase [Rubrivivax sp.]|nr:serine/threonine protein kinase [Rubrivivax sp.]
MNPSAPDWAAVRALFDAVQDLQADERDARLAAPGLDPALVAEVRSLLAHTAEDEPFLAGLPEPAAAPLAGREGQRLGAWRIVSLLGSGGMGEVWLAQRDDGAYVGEAAVKLLKRGMDSEAVLARFALEQQALARLSHPHIARLLDAGRSADGLPFFVMERVHGRPIDEACAGLPLEARLQRFLQLADAVAHAHRHLLVHRDLKPGNVLVDDDGQVKLLDFGIAKALDPLEDVGDATQAGQRPFTPQYASPEQVRGEPVTTATDLYSLGVLLYVMLTGQRPYGREASSAIEAARAVLEEDPTRPSSLSVGPQTPPGWWTTRRRLQGDLDNILLKTLEKPVERRYASVDALAADIRNYLGGYPVSAQPARWAYRARKFIGRNRVAVAAGALAAVALVGGTAVALWQAHLAERRFEQVHQFARTMLFDVDKALRDGPTAGREKLVQTSLQYLDSLSAERLRDANLLRDLAEAYERVGDIQGNTMQSNLGRPQDAAQSYAKAQQLRLALSAQAPDDLKNVAGLLNVSERLGDNARSLGDLQAAARHYGQAAQSSAVLARARPDDPVAQVKRIESERYLASVYYWPGNRSLGDYARARPLVEALARDMEALERRFPDALVVPEGASGLLNQVSDFQRLGGDYAASLATLRRNQRVVERLATAQPDNPVWKRWTYLTQGRLADALIDTGAVDEGVALWQHSIALREAVARQDPNNERAQRNVANGYGPLAEQLYQAGRHAEALVWYARENALLRQLRERFPQVGALKPRLLESERDHALALHLVGRQAEATARLQALGTAPGEDPDDPEGAAKFVLVRARVLLAGPLPAAERSALLAQGRQAVAVLARAAAQEAFNVTLAREAALASWHFGRAAGDCGLQRDAAARLVNQRQRGVLPRPLSALVDEAVRGLVACTG